jgi:ribonucleoside-triphosphate reductase
MEVRKCDGSFEEFNPTKVKKGIQEAYTMAGEKKDSEQISEVLEEVCNSVYDGITTQEIRRIIENRLVKKNFKAGRQYILYWAKKEAVNQFVIDKERFIAKYKKSNNNADATVDDNSNTNGKNISLINAEIHKSDNILVSRGMVTRKLNELYPSFNSRNYIKDLESHIIYKHDESSFAGAIAPYCCSISMYPFLINGIENVGGLSAAPKNIDSFCGMYCNLLFVVASQFAGAVATPEFLMYFDYFARKEWGDDYYKHTEEEISCGSVKRIKTIKSQIHQYFQQIIYTANQPASSRNGQSCFLNFSYFDKPFFDAMFENFYFPDGTKPLWDSLNWLQKDFMMWFNEERLRCLLTFPVESFALIYKDGKFEDEENAKFVADELARGHSFFIYISDTADSLSSCCRLKNKIQTNEFSFTNGNIGVETGSKSVITLNLNRITQNFCKKEVRRILRTSFLQIFKILFLFFAEIGVICVNIVQERKQHKTDIHIGNYSDHVITELWNQH